MAVDRIYTANDGETHAIRLDAARATAGGFTAGGTATSDIKAKVSKSNREHGLRPRMVSLRKNDGTDEEPNYSYSRLPVATEAAFNGAGFARNATISIDGDSWTVVGKIQEDY
jgi:hypothetical protein